MNVDDVDDDELNLYKKWEKDWNQIDISIENCWQEKKEQDIDPQPLPPSGI